MTIYVEDSERTKQNLEELKLLLDSRGGPGLVVFDAGTPLKPNVLTSEPEAENDEYDMDADYYPH